MVPAPMNPMPEAMVFGGEGSVEAVGREDHEQGGSHSHEVMGAESCLLGAVLALKADDASEQGGDKDANEKVHGLSLFTFGG